MSWNTGANAMDGGERGSMSLAFKSRVKAMHHWIKKGNGDRAYAVARELFHQARSILRTTLPL